MFSETLFTFVKYHEGERNKHRDKKRKEEEEPQGCYPAYPGDQTAKYPITTRLSTAPPTALSVNY